MFEVSRSASLRGGNLKIVGLRRKSNKEEHRACRDVRGFVGTNVSKHLRRVVEHSPTPEKGVRTRLDEGDLCQ